MWLVFLSVLLLFLPFPLLSVHLGNYTCKQTQMYYWHLHYRYERSTRKTFQKEKEMGFENCLYPIKWVYCLMFWFTRLGNSKKKQFNCTFTSIWYAVEIASGFLHFPRIFGYFLRWIKLCLGSLSANGKLIHLKCAYVMYTSLTKSSKYRADLLRTLKIDRKSFGLNCYKQWKLSCCRITVK